MNVGTATVAVAGRGNYAGAKSATFQVKSPVTSLAGAAVSAVGMQAYTGRAVCPQPTVRVGGKTLRLGADYALTYRNNVRAGTATVVVTGRGSYAGTRSATFRIVAPSVSYCTHIQNIGWQGWRANGAMSGTSGKGLRLEAIEIRLTGQMARLYDVYYRVHAQSFGWMGWAKNGAQSGTAGLAKRLEAIQIVLLPKSSKAPATNYGGCKQATAAPFRQK